MDQRCGHPVEILAMENGDSLGTPSALVTLRPNPDHNLESVAILFNQEQVLRLRDTFDLFLNHPESSLCLSVVEQAVEGE